MRMNTSKRFLAAVLALLMVLSLVPVTTLLADAAEANLIDVWDFGAEELDTTVYNNMLTVDEINSWYGADVAPGSSGVALPSFTTSDGLLSFNANGKTNNRLRTTNEAITRYDNKSLTDADGNVYTGYVYSNSSATSAIYLSVQLNAGDIVTLAVGSNGKDSMINFEAPSGAVQQQEYLSSGAKIQLQTYYASESGAYKIYSTTEKLVVARIYREATNTVTVTGTVSAPADLTDYSIVFTNTASGAVVSVPVENGAYTASLNDCYTYEVSLAGANGYIITSDKTLTIEKGAASATLDVTVLAVSQVTVSGSITGLSDAALADLKLSLVSDAIYVPQVVIDGTSYTVEVEVGQEYTLVAEGVNDYQITSGTTLLYTGAATADIVFEAKPVHNVTIVPDGATAEDLASATFTFTNLNEEGYVYTFTGTQGIALRDGVYSVTVSNSGIYVQQLTSNLKVNGADVSKTIPFSSDITEWDFRGDDFTGQSPYNGLAISGSFNKHGSTYGMQIKNATIEVPVSGACEIQVAVGYNWDITFPDGTNCFDNTNSGDITLSYTHTGGAGTVSITVGSQCTSYIKYIKVVETIAYKQTVTVGASGCDYTTINDALDAVRAMKRPNNERVTISIQPGNYEEMLVIDVPNVTLVNASATPSIELTNAGVDIDANAVRITSYYGHGYTYYSMGSDCKWDETILQVNKENGYASFENPGSGTTSGSYWNATVVISADGFQAEGIIFENSFNQYVSEKAASDVIVAQGSAKEGSTPRASLPAGSTAVQDKAYVERAAALAIANNCSQIYFENCKFVGRQDTLYGGTGVTAAFYDCSIYGACDYIFGGMTAVFAKCDLVFNTSENSNDVGYITAAQTASGSHGMLMYNCHITSTTPGVDTASEYASKPGYYGRPWAAATGEAVFYNTVIDATCQYWYASGASLITPAGWLSTLSGESALCGEYGTYEYALDVDNSASRASWAAVFETEYLADGSPISVETFLGDWDAFAGKDMTIVIPTDKVDNSPKTEEDDGEDSATTSTYTFDSLVDVTPGADKEAIAAGTTYADGYFKIVGSVTQRYQESKGGVYAIEIGKNLTGAMEFTVSNTADLTMTVCSTGGSNTSAVAIIDAAGNVIANNEGITEVSGTTAVTLTYTGLEAGTYQIVSPESSYNRGFRLMTVQVDEIVAVVTTEYTFDSQVDVTPGADKDTIASGTTYADGYFKIVGSVTQRYSSSKGVYAIEIGKNLTGAMEFTVTGTADVTITVCSTGGTNTSAVAIIDAEGNVIANNEGITEVSGTTAVTLTYTGLEAGTYQIVSPESSYNRGFRLMTVHVAQTSSGQRPARQDWSTVAAPVITDVTANGNNVIVSFNMVVDYDGADSVVVTLTDAQGNEVDTASYATAGTSGSVTLTPGASGTYTISIAAIRADEENKSGESVTVAYVLPLKAPYIASATSTGGGKINVVWLAVDEAESYELYCDGTLVATTTNLEYEVSGLTLGTKYTFTVVAVRGEDKSAASEPLTAEATESAQTVWGFTTYGASTSTSSNGYIVNDDGSVTVYSEGGKGKIVPASTDGVAFYYTAIPTEYNFTLRATVTVDSWAFSNGQEGFGLLATDRLGTHGSSAAFWNNQYMASVTKSEYTIDGTKYTMKLGVNTIAKTGVTVDNLPLLEVNDSDTVANEFSSVSTALETYAYNAGNGAGTYNIVGNYASDPGGTILELTTFVLEIQKNNTGYFITYYDTEGNVIGQVKNYDPNALSMVDAENVYVGFFASRNARITIADYSLTTILATEDAPAEERPVTYVDPTVTITSGSTANSASYTAYIYSNVSGTVTVTMDDLVLVQDVAVTAGERCDISGITLAEGANKLVVTLTPDPDQDLGAYTELSSTDPVTTSITVTYKTTWATRNNLYVAPNGSSTATGTREDPLDIYTAVKYVRPGQKIILMEGTYALTSTVRIEHGIDGGENGYIYMIADPEAASRPVLDFQGACAGIVHGGDYWYFQGFDVTNSKNGEKGFQISGHHNVVDQVNTYKNGNTGIQISRYASTDPQSEWPSYNLVLNCTSHNNADAGYEDADGFAAKLTCGEGNVFDGCVAYHNADDGWDLYAKVETGPIGSVTIQNCVAYENGYIEADDGSLINAGNGNGFKMGGESLSGKHMLINSFAFFNKAKGIDSNSCPDIIVSNSTSYNNGSYNVAFYTNNAANTNFIADGIISFKDSSCSGYTIGEQHKPVGSQDTSKYLGDTNYYWNGSQSLNASGAEITADMFVTLTFTGVFRNEDGTLHMNGFLELKEDVTVNAGATCGGTASSDVPITPDLEPILYGDVDGDGDVDIMDANLILAYYNEAAELTADQLVAANVDGDGDVDIMDANLIVAHYNESLDVFPVEKG